MDDGFVDVSRKNGKAKHGSKSRHIDGIRLNKPNPNFFYRPAGKSFNVPGGVSSSKPSDTTASTSSQPINKSSVGSKQLNGNKGLILLWLLQFNKHLIQLGLVLLGSPISITKRPTSQV